MTARTPSPALAQRAAELVKHGLPPQPVRELMEDIQGDIRVAKLRQALTGQADQTLVAEIVAKKHRLKGMYSDWVKGKNLV